MKNVASRTLISIASFAAVMSLLWAVFVPHGYPWPILAWAGVSFAMALWAGMSAHRPNPRMSDVIDDVESESLRAAPAASRGGVDKGRPVREGRTSP